MAQETACQTSHLKDVTTILDYDMTVDDEFKYLPYGTKESGQFTWQNVTRKVNIERRGV